METNKKNLPEICIEKTKMVNGIKQTNYQKKIEHIAESYSKKLFTLPLPPLAVPYFEEFMRTGKIVIGDNDYIGKTRGFDALMFLRKEFRKKHVKTRLHGHSIVEI